MSEPDDRTTSGGEAHREPSGGAHAGGNDDVEVAVRAVADRIKADLPRLLADMTAMFADMIEEFRHDDEVRRLMEASTAANLAAILDLLTLGISFDDLTVPPAAAEYARRFAQHGMSLEALLRAYRLGEHMFAQTAITVLRTLDPSAELALATTSRIAERINRYIDGVIEGVIDIYENERRRWDARTDATRAAQVRAVLEGEDLDLASAEQMLGTSLRGWHLAAVIWTPPGSSASYDLLRTGVGMLAAATGKQPLTILVDEHNCWAWISSTGKPSLDPAVLDSELRKQPSLRMAVGDRGAGLAGFRQTFHDAQCARGVAVAAAKARQLTLYPRVALAGLLKDSLPDVRVWARRVLGDLMRDDESTARLRETAQVYLDARGSLTDAAARMHVHKNTVHYRIRKAEELLGHSLGTNRLDVEIALMVCAQFGLTTPASGHSGTPR
ncbi:DNA-binding transcriptional regulator, PucR family [Nocardia amikacinitolerans]|uniref:DNA-binding transcriptional regulator, PucR family n=1 Tax=Nocardia amikacinitolerans TaxID=756689 RepID=A0A285L535_9NOCA|nr:helix-turn-helix domain-containing protein [Nocardia amikacinitolerans]SNY79573.1 DNA-binding transcriptional regulator, PucR family [Nocardia amikacinitolerans]